jgi:hypothetical protein
MYGLFDTSSNTLTRTKAETPERIATILLWGRMKEEGMSEYTKENTKIFMQGWADNMNENFFDERDDHTISEISDEVANNIVYNNAPHIIDMRNRTEVSNEFKQAVYNRLVVLLTFRG